MEFDATGKRCSFLDIILFYLYNTAGPEELFPRLAQIRN
jgi:hypothetical protein